MDLKQNFTHLAKRDKKLLVKVIAGVLLLAIAFAVYLAKEISSDQGAIAITGTTENGVAGEPPQGGIGIETGTNAEGDPLTDLEATGEKTILVDVSGAVMNPTVVKLPEGSRVFEAIDKAGGVTGDADTGMINRAELLTDGIKIYVPTKQEVEQGLVGSDEQTSSIVSYSAAGDGGKSNLININTADTTTLQQLTGVGPAIAEKIIDFRQSNGQFKTIEDLKNVSGIGDKTFEKFKDKITV